MDLFKELIPSLLSTKNYFLENPDEEKSYVPFMVNRALSYHIDTVLYANEMNRLHQADKKLQYDYLFHSVKARKRPFQKWHKKEKADSIEAIKTFFGYSTQKAEEVLRVLTEDQVNQIVAKTTIGGIGNAKSKK